MRIAIILTAALLAAGCAGTRLLPQHAHDPHAAFRETDRDGDGSVDQDEFHLRLVEIFFHGDRDKDGYMTYEEIAAVAIFQEDWSEVDLNQDGRVSLHEFARKRFEDYEEVDANHDGLLSESEVVRAFEAEP